MTAPSETALTLNRVKNDVRKNENRKMVFYERRIFGKYNLYTILLQIYLDLAS
jgi:hypothetical protein